MGFDSSTAIVRSMQAVDRRNIIRPDISRAAMIGNFPPRRCGLATFTRDTFESLRRQLPAASWRVVAMEDGRTRHDYPEDVTDIILQDEVEAYDRVADQLNESGVQIVFLQHEFGIFGGPDGVHLLRLLRKLKSPIISTLHTVLERPSPNQKRVMDEIISLSSAVITMTDTGADLLERVHHAGPTKVHVIPHGAPERPFAATDAFKAPIGLTGRRVIMTFGLLSPNKGIETIIQALPDIVAKQPDTTYLVVGQTHPHIVAHEGEAYRDSLIGLARSLGVADNLRFINRFVDEEELFDLLQAADIYVTPYLTEAQITSGTLSYAVALGKPVVSTPYWHAMDLLADNVGVICPFGDSAAFAREIGALLADDHHRNAMARRAWQAGQPSHWRNVAASILSIASAARITHQQQREQRFRALAHPRTTGLVVMSDDCGLFQHSRFGIPDRRHGYTTDDNVRALALLARLSARGPLDAGASRLLAAASAFVAHAWNPDSGRFRNFMSYERTWLDDGGSDDCCARSLEALCTTARSIPDSIWAADLARQALQHTSRWTSLRAHALTIRALLEGAGPVVGIEEATRLMQHPADVLLSAAQLGMREPHGWFEPCFSYDNANLPGALIRAGQFLQDPAMLSAGLDMLERLMARQKTPSGLFAPVATSCFDAGASHALFDQQPLEALSTIEACLAAWHATGDASHVAAARRVFRWFGGENVHGLALARPDDGICHDGLTIEGLNQNHGAESILSYHLAALAIREALVGAADEPRSGRILQ